jgi:hypothetical protein
MKTDADLEKGSCETTCFLLSHEGRSWIFDPTHPRLFMRVEENLDSASSTTVPLL